MLSNSKKIGTMPPEPPSLGNVNTTPWQTVLKQGLLFETWGFKNFKIESEVVNKWVGHSVYYIRKNNEHM